MWWTRLRRKLTMPETVNLLPLITRIREQYPTPMTHAQIGEAMYRIAVEAGGEWGLLLKPGGSNVPSPIGPISADILVHVPEEQEYDVFSDVDGAGTPVFNKLPFKCGEGLSGCEMRRVKVVAGQPVPSPTPDPAPPLPLPVPVPPPVSGPRVGYGIHTSLGLEIGEILNGEGSPYRFNGAAIGECVAHLLWKVQFEDYSAAAARENARKRARNEPAD